MLFIPFHKLTSCKKKTRNLAELYFNILYILQVLPYSTTNGTINVPMGYMVSYKNIKIKNYGLFYKKASRFLVSIKK